MSESFLSCDWGTSSFRLKFGDIESHSIIKEINNENGILSTFLEWKSKNQKEGVNRIDYFLGKLKMQIDSLSTQTKLPLSSIPVVISGMAGSSVGIMELPYASLPFSTDGENIISYRLCSTNVLSNPIYLVSGLSSSSDVMRGEETQIIGLSDIYKIDPTETTICIFPGTHSKHVILKDNKVVDFYTYMTGELFSIIKQNSILKEGIAEIDNRNSLTIKNRKAFFGGVEKSIDTNLLRTLFSVRINHIFERLNGIENYYYLSGLLIGSELRGISKAGGRIMLCSNIKTSYLYELAINIIGLKKVTTIVPPNIVDSAAFEGHISILKKFELN